MRPKFLAGGATERKGNAFFGTAKLGQQSWVRLGRKRSFRVNIFLRSGPLGSRASQLLSLEAAAATAPEG